MRPHGNLRKMYELSIRIFLFKVSFRISRTKLILRGVGYNTQAFRGKIKIRVLSDFGDFQVRDFD